MSLCEYLYKPNGLSRQKHIICVWPVPPSLDIHLFQCPKLLFKKPKKRDANVLFHTRDGWDEDEEVG